MTKDKGQETKNNLPFGTARLGYEIPDVAPVSSLGFQDAGYWKAAAQFFVNTLGEADQAECLFDDYYHLIEFGEKHV